jgi:transposase
MMERSNGNQQKMVYATVETLMPREHFLRDLEQTVNFDFVYDKVECLYSQIGRRSIDPVVVVKMLLLGYLYGIESERRLEKEIQVNIAYRWFLGIELDEPVPDHSTLSQLRRRKFKGTAVFEEIFAEIVQKCIDSGLVEGKLLLTDSTHVRANVRNDVREKVMVDVEPSAYLRRLNAQAEQDGVMPRKSRSSDDDSLGGTPAGQKEVLKSPTDPECGFMKRPGKPLGFYYLSHQTCDGKHGIITDVCVTPGNARDSTVHSERIQHQIRKFGFAPEGICADSAYDSSEIHKDMLDMGIKTFIPKTAPHYAKKDFFGAEAFCHSENGDYLICPNGCRLQFSTYRPWSGMKRYKSTKEQCDQCALRSKCVSGAAKYKEVEQAYYGGASEKQ